MPLYPLPKIYHPDFAVLGKKPVGKTNLDFSGGLTESYNLFQFNGGPVGETNRFSNPSEFYSGELFNTDGAVVDASGQTGWQTTGHKTSFPISAFFGFKILGSPNQQHALWLPLDSINNSATGHLYIRYDQGTNNLQILESFTAVIGAHNQDLDDGKTHHICIVALSTTAFKLFLDGALVIDVPSYGGVVNSPTAVRTLGSEGGAASRGRANGVFSYAHELSTAVSDVVAIAYTADPYRSALEPATPPVYFTAAVSGSTLSLPTEASITQTTVTIGCTVTEA